MSFGQSIRTVLSKYATFSGRARRSEYWWFYLFVLLVLAATSVLDSAAGTQVLEGSGAGWITTLVGLALLLPNLAVGVRRLHDTGRSGWWLLLGFVPIVGLVALIYFFTIDSENDNAYGPYPKD